MKPANHPSLSSLLTASLTTQPNVFDPSTDVSSSSDASPSGLINQEESIANLLIAIDSDDPLEPSEHDVLASINAITEVEDVDSSNPGIVTTSPTKASTLSPTTSNNVSPGAATSSLCPVTLIPSPTASNNVSLGQPRNINENIIHLCNIENAVNNRTLITIDMEVEGRNVEALIDSGAEVSVLSSSIIDTSSQVDSTTAAGGWRLVAAAGQEIKVHARRTLHLKLGHCRLEHPFFVADISRSLIIGIDLLRRMKAKADFATGTIQWCQPPPPSAVGGGAPTETQQTMYKTIMTLSTEQAQKDFPESNLTIAPEEGWSVDAIANPALKQILDIFSKKFLFASNPKAPPRNTKVSHHIDVRGPPVRQPPRQRNSVTEEEFIESEVRMMLANGIISASQSEWAANVVVVKKSDGTNRFCVDSRPLNKVTIPDMYPFPRIDEILRSLGKARIFSKLDMASSYWQIPIALEDRHKTSFICKLGQFQFNVLSFGLRNAPATFQRAIEKALREDDLLGKCAIAYIDDIIIFSESFEEHLKHVEKVFVCLIKAGFALKKSKCLFAATRIPFLGHVVSPLGIAPDPEKIRAVSEYPRLRSVDDVRAFVGLAGFYRDHIKDFAKVAYPLHKLLRQGVHFEWQDEQETAFVTLKTRLTSAPILTYPNFDRPFTITTDFCSEGIGAVLSQSQGVIEYASRSLTPAEQHYYSSEGECFAVIWAIDRFRYYIEGRHFTLETDNAAVSWLLNKQFTKLTGANGRLARWAYSLMGADFEVKPRRGKDNGAADGLSRGALPGDPSQSNAFTPSTDDGADIPRRAEINAYAEVRLSHKRARDGPPVHSNSSATDGSEVNVSTDLIERIKQAYRHDPLFDALINYSNTAMLPADQDLATRVMQEFPYYEVHDGLVLRVLGNDKDTLIAVPRSIVTQVIQHVHETAAHLGVQKTFKTIRTRFFWSPMLADISAIIGACSVCQRAKQPTTNPYSAPLHPLPMVTDPNGRAAIDIISFSCTNPRGYIGAAVMTDYLSRRASIYAIKGEAATDIAPVLMKYVSIYGAPLQLLSDRGAVFLGEVVRQFCKMFMITKVNTTSYHPQCDGLVERFNRTLISMLTTYVGNNQGDWDQYLAIVEYAYNTSVQPSIGVSPFEATFGFPAVMPFEAAVANIASDRGWGTPMPLYIMQLRSQLAAIWALCHTYLGAAQEAQREAYDSRHIEVEYKVDDLVLLNVSQIPTAADECKKLRYTYQGPYKVTERHPTNNHLVKLTPAAVDVNPGLAMSYVNTARLRPFKVLPDRIAHADAAITTASDDPNAIAVPRPIAAGPPSDRT